MKNFARDLISLWLFCVWFIFNTPIIQSQGRATDNGSIQPSSAKGFDLHFRQEPILELELERGLSTNLDRRLETQVFARLVRPLQADDGTILLDTTKNVTLNVILTPGHRIGAPGEITLSLRPVIQDYRNEPLCRPEATSALRDKLCNAEYQLTFSTVLESAQFQSDAGIRIIQVKPNEEGLKGSRRPTHYQYPLPSEIELRAQALIFRNGYTALVSDAFQALQGVFKFALSKKNLELPAQTRLQFVMGQRIRFDRPILSPNAITIHTTIPLQPLPKPRRLSAMKKE